MVTSMNDQVCPKLAEILREHGTPLLHDAHQLEERLNVQCADFRDEVTALMNAFHEGIPAALLAGADASTVSRLKARVQANQDMQADVASWAVDTWVESWKAASRGPRQTPPPEEKLESKDLLHFVRIIALFAVVGFLCLYVVIQLFPPVLGFYMDAKVAILREFASGNYGYALGRIAGTLVVTGLFLLLLGLAAKLLGIVKKAILK